MALGESVGAPDTLCASTPPPHESTNTGGQGRVWEKEGPRSQSFKL